MSASTEKFEVPKTHKACVFDKPGSCSIAIQDHETPEPGPGEVLINLTHSGVCHSDCGVMMSNWSILPHPTQPGQVGGHEGVGHIVKLGEGADESGLKLGQRVGIKWIAYACLRCPPCLDGFEGCCDNQKISGYYYPGTFQQYAIGPASYVTPIPDGLESVDAAPMLCAGVTVYSALRRSGAKSGQWVVIAGSGGGLGHLALQIGSKGMAFRMIGIDSAAKKDISMESGAEHFIDAFSHDDKSIAEEVKKLTGGQGAAAVIVCTNSNRAYGQALGMLRKGGTLVCLGIPEGDPVPIANASPGGMLAFVHRIIGSAVGNRLEASEVLGLAARGVIKTKSRTVKMNDLQDVLADLNEGKIAGRVVVDLSA